MAGEFRVQHVATVPKGYKVRTITRARHRVRIAFPPGRRVKGSGTVVEVLHPRNENPCPVKNPAELVLMSANPWQIVVRSKISHRGEEIWPATFTTRKAAKEYAYSKFTEGSVLRYERISNPAELVLLSANPHRLESLSENRHRLRTDDKKFADYTAKEWKRQGYKVFRSKSGKEFFVEAHLKPQSNPSSQAEQAADLYEEFHGAAPQHVDTYEEPSPRGMTLTELGDLIELRVEREAGWKWASLELSGRGIKLASDAEGRQLYFVGGDQKILRGTLTAMGVDNSKQLADLGALRYVVYRTKKSIVDHIAATYEHFMGEETKIYPRLMYDRSGSEPRLKISGGEYTVRAEGIVN